MKLHLTCLLPLPCVWCDGCFCSRSRERYRERDNGRGQQEGRSRGGGVEAGGSATRSFSGNLPTILQQPRERTTSDERTSTGGNYYEENAEGSGDASSVGDPESAAALEAGTRHGPRGGSKSSSSSSRQVVVERRERREGKWERKHSWAGCGQIGCQYERTVSIISWLPCTVLFSIMYVYAERLMKMAVSIGGFGVLFHRSFSSRIFVELINGVFFYIKQSFCFIKLC